MAKSAYQSGASSAGDAGDRCGGDLIIKSNVTTQSNLVWPIGSRGRGLSIQLEEQKISGSGVECVE